MVDEFVVHPLLCMQAYGVPAQITLEHIIDRPLTTPFTLPEASLDPADPARFWNGGTLPEIDTEQREMLQHPLQSLGRFPCWHGQYDPGLYLTPVYAAASQFAADVLAGKVKLAEETPGDDHSNDPFDDGNDFADPFMSIMPMNPDGTISPEMIKKLFGG